MKIRWKIKDRPDRFKYRIDAGKIDRLSQATNSVITRLIST